LGTKTKAEAYAELSSLGLQPPSSTESQEICFIPDDDYRLFLEQALDDLPGPGPIIDHQGRSYGQHQGLWRYTLGQRRGLGIAHSQPLYVLKKDISNNTLIVGPKARCWIGHCLVSDLNPFLPVADWPSQTWIQTNYRRPAVACRVQRQDRQILARFEPTGPTAPGQLACFYDRLGRLLAGGLIQPEV
jgi:tRNA-specific 2-thiouridylase